MVGLLKLNGWVPMLVVQSLNLRHWWFWWLSHQFLWFMFKLFYILHQKLENILHLKICYNEIRVQILHPQNFFQDDLFVEMLVFMVFAKTKVRFGYRWTGIWVFYVFFFSWMLVWHCSLSMNSDFRLMNRKKKKGVNSNFSHI